MYKKNEIIPREFSNMFSSCSENGFGNLWGMWKRHCIVQSIHPLKNKGIFSWRINSSKNKFHLFLIKIPFIFFLIPGLLCKLSVLGNEWMMNVSLLRISLFFCVHTWTSVSAHRRHSTWWPHGNVRTVAVRPKQTQQRSSTAKLPFFSASVRSRRKRSFSLSLKKFFWLIGWGVFFAMETLKTRIWLRQFYPFLKISKFLLIIKKKKIGMCRNKICLTAKMMAHWEVVNSRIWREKKSQWPRNLQFGTPMASFSSHRYFAFCWMRLSTWTAVCGRWFLPFPPPYSPGQRRWHCCRCCCIVPS